MLRDRREVRASSEAHCWPWSKCSNPKPSAIILAAVSSPPAPVKAAPTRRKPGVRNREMVIKTQPGAFGASPSRPRRWFRRLRAVSGRRSASWRVVKQRSETVRRGGTANVRIFHELRHLLNVQFPVPSGCRCFYSEMVLRMAFSGGLKWHTGTRRSSESVPGLALPGERQSSGRMTPMDQRTQPVRNKSRYYDAPCSSMLGS